MVLEAVRHRLDRRHGMPCPYNCDRKHLECAFKDFENDKINLRFQARYAEHRQRHALQAEFAACRVVPFLEAVRATAASTGSQ